MSYNKTTLADIEENVPKLPIYSYINVHNLFNVKIHPKEIKEFLEYSLTIGETSIEDVAHVYLVAFSCQSEKKKTLKRRIMHSLRNISTQTMITRI